MPAGDIGFTLEVSDELRKIAGTLAQSAQAVQKSGPVGGGGGGSLRDEIRRATQEEKTGAQALSKQTSTRQAYSTGASAGNPDTALSELQSGGMGAATIQKTMQDYKSFQDLLGKKKESGSGSASPQSATMVGTAMQALSGGEGEHKFGKVHIDRLELSSGAAGALGRALARGMRIGGGGSGLFGGGSRGGGGGGGTDAAATMGQGITGAGASIPFAGIAIGIAGAMISLVSSLAQRRQQAMESQDQTLDALGYVGGGGGLVRNAELAQIKLTRARNSQSGVDTEVANNDDIRFGLAQGIGASEGAQIFGQFGLYSRGGELNRGRLRSLLGSANAAGMGGFRESEFLQELGGIAERQVQGGFGRLNTEEFARMAGGLHRRGMSSENTLSFLSNISQQMQSQGNPLQNLAIAAGMNNGLGYVDATMRAEQGATGQNLAAVAGMLDLGGMDADTRAIVEQRLFGATMTQAGGARQHGGLISGLDQTAQGMALQRSAGGSTTIDRMAGDGQLYRSTANRIDESLMRMEQLSIAHAKFTDAMLQVVEGATELVDEAIGKFNTLQSMM